MKFETDRFICTIRNDLAEVRFKSPKVAEYADASLIGQELRRVASSHEFRTMLIDCEVLDFITSTMLQAFITAYLRCNKLGRNVKLANVSPMIQEILRTSRVDRIIPVFETMEEALDAG